MRCEIWRVRTSAYNNRITILCTCGWSSATADRYQAQDEFFEHQHPYLTLDQLMDRYGTIDEGADQP